MEANKDFLCVDKTNNSFKMVETDCSKSIKPQINSTMPQKLAYALFFEQKSTEKYKIELKHIYAIRYFKLI
jgi:hypothetical protein